MIVFLSTNPEELFQEIVTRGRAEAVVSQEAFNQLVDTVIEDHRRIGELDDDQALVDMKQSLQERYGDYKEQAGYNK